MITIEVEATVTEDGKIIIPVPADVTPGQHRVVVVIEEKPIVSKKGLPLRLPAHNAGLADPNFTASREQIYDEPEY